MSVLFAKLVRTAAKAGSAGVQGLAYRQAMSKAKKGRRKAKPGCTPCEAMARVDAAKKMVNGV